ncbi:MAG: hypothetical protein Q7J58_17500 [Hydrogenophaga sp.]|nr:hypothetical protein [Hydrogenophaga sp.]MDP3372980.1 hypothetical protein [Hydrogenophaga sp.]
MELVVGGKRVTKATKTADLITACAIDEEEARDLEKERKKLDRERELAYYKNRYQRIKADPVLWARRKAMQAASSSDRNEYRRQYYEANRARINEQKRAHAARRRATQTDAERKAHAEAERDRYRRKREQLLQQRRDERANNREEVNARQRLRRQLAKEKALKMAEKLVGGLGQEGGAA